jgi:hypothetical protein
MKRYLWVRIGALVAMVVLGVMLDQVRRILGIELDELGVFGLILAFLGLLALAFQLGTRYAKNPWLRRH